MVGGVLRVGVEGRRVCFYIGGRDLEDGDDFGVRIFKGKK